MLVVLVPVVSPDISRTALAASIPAKALPANTAAVGFSTPSVRTPLNRAIRFQLAPTHSVKKPYQCTRADALLTPLQSDPIYVTRLNKRAHGACKRKPRGHLTAWKPGNFGGECPLQCHVVECTFSLKTGRCGTGFLGHRSASASEKGAEVTAKRVINRGRRGGGGGG